jgi:hypothetical protein
MNRVVMTWRREFHGSPPERRHEGRAPIANKLDDLELVPPKRRVDFDVVRNSDFTQQLEKIALSLKKMNIRVPQGIVSIEDEIEPAVAGLGNHYKEGNARAGNGQMSWLEKMSRF